MRAKKDKAVFIEDCEKRIVAHNKMMKFYNETYLPLLKKFDGKVYNIRFIKALREMLPEDRWYVRELHHNYIELEVGMSRHNYTDTETLYMACILTPEGRISYDLTVTDKYGQTWVENFDNQTVEYMTVIDNYDLMVGMVEDLEKHIKVWNELPYTFRNNVDTNYLRIY